VRALDAAGCILADMHSSQRSRAARPHHGLSRLGAAHLAPAMARIAPVPRCFLRFPYGAFALRQRPQRRWQGAGWGWVATGNRAGRPMCRGSGQRGCAKLGCSDGQAALTLVKQPRQHLTGQDLKPPALGKQSPVNIRIKISLTRHLSWSCVGEPVNLHQIAPKSFRSFAGDVIRVLVSKFTFSTIYFFVQARMRRRDPSDTNKDLTHHLLTHSTHSGRCGSAHRSLKNIEITYGTYLS